MVHDQTSIYLAKSGIIAMLSSREMKESIMADPESKDGPFLSFLNSCYSYSARRVDSYEMETERLDPVGKLAVERLKE